MVMFWSIGGLLGPVFLCRTRKRVLRGPFWASFGVLWPPKCGICCEDSGANVLSSKVCDHTPCVIAFGVSISGFTGAPHVIIA